MSTYSVSGGEIAVPSIIELRNRINTDKNRISQNIVKRIESCKLLLKRFKMRTPKDRIDDYYLKIDSLVKSMDNCIKMKTMSLRRQLAEQAAKLGRVKSSANSFKRIFYSDKRGRDCYKKCERYGKGYGIYA